MAKIKCAVSGIPFQCEHFPITLDHSESSHPIFTIPLKRLFRYFPKWQSGELTKIDSYLLFLSYLKSTDLCEFRSSATYCGEATDRIVSSNMESLFYTIGRIITIRHPRFAVPSFVVSKETSSLDNVKHWIASWEEAYDSFCSGLRDQELRSRLQRKESALERLIKNPALHPTKYSSLLADWASEAAAFPQFEMRDPNSQEVISICDYWKGIIRSCYNGESIIQIPESDLQELIDHCETEIDLGSIQSYHLFNTLREGLLTIQGFYSRSSFTILDSTMSDSAINLVSDIDISNNENRPKRTQFKSEFAFLKAKMKWELAISLATSAGKNSENGEVQS